MSRPAPISEMPPPFQVEHNPVAMKDARPMLHPQDKIDNDPRREPHLKPPAEKIEAPPLPDPSNYNPNTTSLAGSIVAMLENIIEVSDIQKGAAQSVIDSVEAGLVVKEKEALEMAQLEGEHVESLGWYDYMKKLATCVLAAFAIIVGGTMIADNPESLNHLLTGSAMVTSGVTSILGRIMQDTHTAPQTANLMFVISAGFGLVGGTAYMNMSAHTLSDIAGKIVMASISIISGMADLGKEWSHFRLGDIRGEQLMLRELMERCRRITDEQVACENSSNMATSSAMMSCSQEGQEDNRVKRSIIANMLTASAV